MNHCISSAPEVQVTSGFKNAVPAVACAARALNCSIHSSPSLCEAPHQQKNKWLWTGLYDPRLFEIIEVNTRTR